MKRLVYLSLLLLLILSIWSFGPSTGKVEALTIINLTSPPDSAKVTTPTPTFKWRVVPVQNETPHRFHIKVADNPAFTNPNWEDSTITGSDSSKTYGGTPLIMWKTYYWVMNVEVDSQTTSGIKTYWQEEFTAPFTFFYTTATLFHIQENGQGDLPTIQTGIVWAAANDTVLVEKGTYYENLRFFKKDILVASNYIFNNDTTTINKTIIDGSHLVLGNDYGSVVFFSPRVDSTAKLKGLTLRGGKGTKTPSGTEDKFNGGGIYCSEGSSPTISYNVITDNHVADDGGGIFINSAAPNIFHNLIINNTAQNGSGGGIEATFSIQVEATPHASPENQNQDDITNSLYPKDATEVAPAVPGSMAKTALGSPPVAVVTYLARRDTLIHRDKYLIGDTLIFDGTGSSDPDGGDITYRWSIFTVKDCPSGAPTSPTLVDAPVCTLAITNVETGLLKVFLRVRDTEPSSGFSDTLVFSVQYPPNAQATANSGPPGDTIWLDATRSCDINPLDVLSYHWTQDSGVVSVDIQNADSAKAYFVPTDMSFLGKYYFKVTISDSMDSSFANVNAVVSRPPFAVCDTSILYGDTLVGYTTSDTMILDGSSSYDPDPGDSVLYWIWQPVMWYFVTQNGPDSLPLSVNPVAGDNIKDSTKVIHKFTYGQGGLIKFRLRVRDTFGISSQNYDSVFYSIETRAVAQAGKDTIVYTSSRAHLKGSALEINPDQKNSLKYKWEWVQRPTPVPLEPSDTLQSVSFNATLSGVYRLTLRVDDGYGQGDPDEIKILANILPDANVINVAHAVEGNPVTLDASASVDPDAATFGGGLKYSWSVVVDSVPSGAEIPSITDADKSIASFIPYGTGTFWFRVLVNDTISVYQLPDSSATGNIAFLWVNVDSTYAYPIIQGNLIAHNYAGGKGGGVDCNKSSAGIINNIFYKNQSKSSGGAICCRNFSTPEVKSNIFFGNLSTDSTGGAIADIKGALTAPSASRGVRKYLTVKYNDFWNNRGGTLYQTGSDTAHNIFVFPRLIDPDFGDFTLDCTSPCRGAGDPLHPDIGSLIYYQPCNNAENLTMLELSLFQNPAATAIAHFLINTDAPLKNAPEAYVKMGDNAPGSVFFTAISANSYRGSYVFTSSDTAKITISATSLLEKDTSTTRDFTVQLIGAGQGGTLSSADKMMKIIFPAGSVKDQLYATCMDVTGDSRYKFEGKPEAEATGQVYQLGPLVSFEKELTVSFPLDQLVVENKDKAGFSVYGYEDGKWNRMESYLDGNSVCSKVKKLSVYRLAYDPTAKQSASLPKAYELFQNSPNPFNPETQIRYDLPATGHVELTVYNILGQKVKVLVNEVQETGHQSVTWDGKDDLGKEVASGIYFYKLQTENFEKTKKM
ncbi:MAG: T9SS type A sorting domain-containing protein, partial [Candidatus Zixiibacteriota bacterium]